MSSIPCIAYILFADVNVNWYFPPLVIVISLVYSATRYESWSHILPHAFRWAVYTIGFLGVTYGLLLLVTYDLHPIWYILAIGAVLFFSYGISWRKKDLHKDQQARAKK